MNESTRQEFYSNDIVTLVNQFGFRTPTIIQSITIPKILSHNLDIIVAAPTGSGKTEAAIIPLLYNLIRNGSKSHNGIKIIYITPLRALNRDIFNRLKSIVSRFDFTIDIWHGDTTSTKRKKILRSPPDIIITTPESLQILLIKNEIRDSIKPLYAVVIDEVQELISSERGAELAVALERIDSVAGKHVRRILISAPIGDIDSVARYFLSNRRYDIAYVSNTKPFSIDIAIVDGYCEENQHSLICVSDYLCRNLLHNRNGDKQILLFTNTRASAEELGHKLSMCLEEGVALHHSSLSRDFRELIEAMFKKGDLRIVVATSSLELGIDVGGVDLVIQYLSPRQVLKLIQRVGRAGHREFAISKGTIVLPPIITELFESIVIARRATKGLAEAPYPHMAPLDVLAHQIVGLTLERGEISIDEIWRIVGRATPYSSLLLSQLEMLVEFLNTLNLIRCTRNVCRSSSRGLVYYLTTNMLPDTVQYTVKSIIDNKPIGLLDEEFALSCNDDDVIILAGRLWKVINIDTEKREIFVEPVGSSELAVLPKWVGELIPVHRNVAREVCALIRRFCSIDNDERLTKLFDEYNISKNVQTFLIKNREKLCKIYPRDDVLIVEVSLLKNEGKTLIAFYTCLGSRASEAFSLLLNYIIGEVIGRSAAYKSHQLGTIVLVNDILRKDEIINIIKRLYQLSKHPDAIKKVIEAEIKSTPLFKRQLISVAKRFGIIGKNVKINDIRRVVEGLMNMDVVVMEALRELCTEKIDVEEVLRYLENLSRSRTHVKIRIRYIVSPYLEEISALSTFKSLIKYSLIPKNILLEMAKKRILDKELKMFCSSCHYTWNIALLQKVKECGNIFTCFLECPRCGSRAVTLIEDSTELALLSRALRKIKGKGYSEVRLLSNEKEVLEKHKRMIDLIVGYGLAGVVALQGIGIGIKTAKRILARSSDIDSLILNIIEQEKIFLKTSKYWKNKRESND